MLSIKAFGHRFLRARRGGVAITFAMVVVVVLMFAGAAVDFGRAYAARAKLQSAVDRTALFAAANFTDANVMDRSQHFFANNFSFAGVRETTPQVSIAPDSTTTVTSATVLTTSFTSLGGLVAIPIRATAIAQKTGFSTMQVSFTPMAAKCWYAKDIFAFIRDANGNIVQQTKVLSYDYTASTDTGHTTPPISQSSQTYTMQGNGTFGVMMRIYPSPVDRGSRAGYYIDYYSDDPNPRIQTVGACSDSGGQTNSWEDGGDYDYRDFVYSVSCQSGGAGATPVRLIK